MKKLSLLFFALLISSIPQAHAASNPVGIYSISRGVGPDGSEYSGEVKIEDNEGLYYFYWNIPGSPEYRGIGILDKNAMAVSWNSAPGFGIVAYRVEGGHLYGDWFSDRNIEEPGVEDLEGPDGLNGVYQIVKGLGEDAGAPYSGTVEIRPEGEVYKLTWDINGAGYTGVGLLKGNFLFAAWGAAAGIVYYDMKDNEMLGVWATQNSGKTGIENLVRKN